MKYPIESTLQQIIQRINQACKDNNIAKEYHLEFKDQKIPTYQKTDIYKPSISEKDNIESGGLVSGDMRYGVHLNFKVIYTNVEATIVSNDKTLQNPDRELTIFTQSYLCKDYKEYLNGKYKLTMLNVLLYEYILIGAINMEAETKMQINDRKEKIKKAAEVPTTAKEEVPVMVK